MIYCRVMSFATIYNMFIKLKFHVKHQVEILYIYALNAN